VLVTAGVRHGLVPPPLPEAEPGRFEFSAGRAARHVRQLARAPRPPGSAAHAWSEAWLLRVLAILDADTLTQEVVQASPRVPKAAVVRNVAGRLRGTCGGPAVLLVAHYDGHAASPGAGDDASGVAILVEVMRALRVGPPLRHDVIALFTDAEEEGMLGARAFVARHPWRGDVGVVINVDARGAAGRSLMFETGAPNLATIAAFAEEVRAPTASSLFYALYQLLPNDTDFTEFRALGVPGLNFAFLGDVAAYHTPLDSIGRLDRRTLQSQGDAVLELARRFALEGPPADTAGGSSAAFFSAPGLGLVWWPLHYTWPIVGVTVLALGVGIGFGLHRGRLRPGGVLLGAVGVVVGTGLSVAAAVGLRLGLGALLARDPGTGVLEWHPALALAPLVLGLGVALLLLRLARRWATPAALSAGAACAWLAGAGVLALRLPEGSYLFLVPVIGAAIGILLRALLSDETGPPWARWCPWRFPSSRSPSSASGPVRSRPGRWPRSPRSRPGSSHRWSPRSIRAGGGWCRPSRRRPRSGSAGGPFAARTTPRPGRGRRTSRSASRPTPPPSGWRGSPGRRAMARRASGSRPRPAPVASSSGSRSHRVLPGSRGSSFRWQPRGAAPAGATRSSRRPTPAPCSRSSRTRRRRNWNSWPGSRACRPARPGRRGRCRSGRGMRRWWCGGWASGGSEATRTTRNDAHDARPPSRLTVFPPYRLPVPLSRSRSNITAVLISAAWERPSG
jgi:hypothetical protein